MSGCKRSTLILLTTGFLCLAASVSLAKEDKQTRCAQYAQRAVQQYNLGISHPQCNIKPDLRWQPNYENHFTACMHSPKFLMDAERSTRDNILRGCGAWDGNSGATPPPPAASAGLNICGQWVWNGQAYVAHWVNGAAATITVTRFDGHSIAFHRVDLPNSFSAGLTPTCRARSRPTATWRVP
jgi:hypothetical protein